MLSWLSRLFGQHPQAPASRRATVSAVRVRHDDKTISVDDGKGSTATLAWTDLGAVTILTSDRGPLEVDLVWILADREGRRMVAVPMGAEGEHALLKAMQTRLSGFDNMAVVEAMSSTDNGVFQIWPAGEPF